ncbi:MAG: hypothetical protein ACW97P_10140 [Candidatus Hodarchaeales archaeon]|jgi:hypothetical protein
MSKSTARILIKAAGLKRSGNHAVTQWVRSLYDDYAFYHWNNYSLDRKNRTYYYCKTIYETDFSKAKDSENSILFVSFEDCPLRKLGFCDDAMFRYKWATEKRVIICRDILNTFGSRIKGDIRTRRKIVNYWKSHVKNKTGDIFINYNTWLISQDYRDELSKKYFNGESRGLPESTGPWASSFDNKDYFNRWQKYRNHKIMKLVDHEALEMNKQVFGIAF